MTSRDIGVGGQQRFNAFIVAPQTALETGDVNLVAPLWDTEDVHRHGLRMFSVESRYIADKNDLLTMSSKQREAARDYHCLNAYLFNGTVSLGAIFPNIRAATRLRIVGEKEAQQEDYYVEQVSHAWTPTGGGRTALTVTRGWIGGDESYLRALEYAAGRYSSVNGASGTKVVKDPAGDAYSGERLVPA